MKNLNLLPPHIAQHRQKRKLKITMAIAQIVIFTCALFAVLFLSSYERRQVDYSQTMAQRIAALDETPVHLVADIEASHLAMLQFEAFHVANFSEQFEAMWVTYVLDSLPPNAELVRMSFAQGSLLVEGEAAEILDAYAHHQALLDVFESVWIGRMTLLDCGAFRYELRIGVGD